MGPRSKIIPNFSMHNRFQRVNITSSMNQTRCFKSTVKGASVNSEILIMFVNNFRLNYTGVPKLIGVPGLF